MSLISPCDQGKNLEIHENYCVVTMVIIFCFYGNYRCHIKGWQS